MLGNIYINYNEKNTIFSLNINLRSRVKHPFEFQIKLVYTTVSTTGRFFKAVLQVSNPFTQSLLRAVNSLAISMVKALGGHRVGLYL